MFEKPGVISPDSKFFANLRAVAEHPDAYDRFSVEGGVGLAHELSRTQSVSVELTAEYSDIEDFFHPDGERHLLISLPLHYVFDNRDDRLDPTTGFRAAAFGEPTYDILTGATFVKLRGDLSAYRALDGASRFVLAGRVSAGSIFGASLDDIPADRRFYSGGGGSVRGYAYQGIGPRDPNGDPIGGRSFAETSVELRIRINDRFGIVPFVDAGSVSESELPDFSHLKAGAGIGIRYLTPFGPLRVDAAIPLNKGPDDPDFGIYAGVGQAF
jgi:translocation and assembly module TamA